jgi:hypothetical protein
MLATASPYARTAVTSMPTASIIDIRQLLHQRMLATGYSPDDITKVESALASTRLHDTYLRAGYSPDDIAAVTSLFQ